MINTTDDVLQADLNDDETLRRLIDITRNEPDDLMRVMARVRLQDQAVNIIERLLAVHQE